MSKYEAERNAAQRILIEQLLKIDRISDEEIDQEKSNEAAISFTLIRLSKKSKTERAFGSDQADAANADKYLYNDEGLPE